MNLANHWLRVEEIQLDAWMPDKRTALQAVSRLLAGLPGPIGAFLRLQQPVAFDAPDSKPVSLVMALLLPCEQPKLQLLLDPVQPGSLTFPPSAFHAK